MVEIVLVRGDGAEPSALTRAAAVLAEGALLIYPTDTLYALGGLALDARAAAAVRAAKGRADGKPLPLVAADAGQVRSLCGDWPVVAQALAAWFWPGPLSLVLPAASAVPAEITAGTGTIAVRVPALAFTRALCAAAGPLISTSANRAGEPPPVTCGQAVDAVGESAALALDAGEGWPIASTIVDLTGAHPRLVRTGAIPWAEIDEVLARQRS